MKNKRKIEKKQNEYIANLNDEEITKFNFNVVMTLKDILNEEQ